MTGKVAQYAAVLGLICPISLLDVKKAYRREMQEWHPDHHNGKETASQAHERAQAINEAYEFLSEITEKLAIPIIESQRPSHYDNYHTRHTYQERTFKPGFPDPSVFEVFVKSSWIISVGYDQQTQTLFLKLDRGLIYRYFNVP